MGEVFALLSNFSGLVFFSNKELELQRGEDATHGHTASPGDARRSSDPVSVVKRLVLTAAG